jgi:hypothetical protein
VVKAYIAGRDCCNTQDPNLHMFPVVPATWRPVLAPASAQLLWTAGRSGCWRGRPQSNAGRRTPGLRPPAENSRVDSMGKGEIRPSLDPCNNATIKTLFGKQSGADVSYYAHKPGRPSHALHTYFVSHLRMVLDVVVGDGWMDAKRGSGRGNGHKRNGALRHWRRAPGNEPNRRSHAD